MGKVAECLVGLKGYTVCYSLCAVGILNLDVLDMLSVCTISVFDMLSVCTIHVGVLDMLSVCTIIYTSPGEVSAFPLAFPGRYITLNWYGCRARLHLVSLELSSLTIPGAVVCHDCKGCS